MKVVTRGETGREPYWVEIASTGLMSHGSETRWKRITRGAAGVMPSGSNVCSDATCVDVRDEIGLMKREESSS